MSAPTTVASQTTAPTAPTAPAVPAVPESDRVAYRNTLLELARADGRIWCLDSDMGGLEKQFEAELPGQYVDLGIAEANLMSVAAALAGTGIVPFVNTMAAFASARALEQVKIDIAYHGLPVRIVGTHSGFSAAQLGPTHHAQQDLAVMRSMPNLTVLAPADAAETVRMVRAAAYLPGPVYLRLGRAATPPIVPVEPVHPARPGNQIRNPACPDQAGFRIGKAVQLHTGGDVTVVAAGAYPVLFALEAARLLGGQGIAVRVLNMHTIKPLDVAALIDAATGTAGIVTVEDHSVLGGLGGAVAEVLAEHCPARVVRVGIADAFCARPGSHTEQLAAAGVSTQHVVDAVTTVLKTQRRVRK